MFSIQISAGFVATYITTFSVLKDFHTGILHVYNKKHKVSETESVV
jgi:hypothetical protein